MNVRDCHDGAIVIDRNGQFWTATATRVYDSGPSVRFVVGAYPLLMYGGSFGFNAEEFFYRNTSVPASYVGTFAGNSVDDRIELPTPFWSRRALSLRASSDLSASDRVVGNDGHVYRVDPSKQVLERLADSRCVDIDDMLLYRIFPELPLVVLE
ncbi:MAG: hypothetical protein GX610_07140 [Rhodococcus sp.]|nr:hypothetical protein [Rhodococcus sp. (in: high G+C Gram-positive bacteria)]